MKKNDVEKLLSLDDKLTVEKVENQTIDKKQVLLVHVKGKKDKARCPICNKFTNGLYQRGKPQKILYLKNSEQPTYLVVCKRRFKCKLCNKIFTEDLGITNKKDRISLKLKQKISKDLLDINKTLKSIAIENNVTEDLVRNVLKESTKGMSKQVYYLPEVISLDENSTHTDAGIFSLILIDPINRITLDILKSREKAFLIDYFMNVKNRNDVKVVIIDLYATYKAVIKKCFPNAIIVADPFHYTKVVIQALNNVKNRIIKKYEDNKNSDEYRTLKSRKNGGYLLKTFGETKEETKKQEEIKKLILKGKTKRKLKDKFNKYWYGKVKVFRNKKYIEVNRVDELNRMLKVDRDLLDSYNLKEEFMRIKNNVNYKDVKPQLIEWIKKCKDSNIPEMISAGKTIETWLEEIVNSFKDDRYSNGFTEANNKQIDIIVSYAYGYKNFEIFRLRTLSILRKSYSIGTKKNLK